VADFRKDALQTNLISARLAAEHADGSLDLTALPVPLANVPTIRNPDVNAIMKAVAALKQISEVREGLSGSVMDKHLTLRDLMNEGALSINIGSSKFLGNPAASLAVGSGYIDPRPVLGVPPVLTTLVASAAFTSVVLSWSMLDYANHAYVEIWRHTADVIGAATLIGTSLSNLYTDASGTSGVTYYYWVRAVAIGGALGPFNATAGTTATPNGSAILADLSVTADKLSQGTYPNINLAPNGSAEDGLVCWRIVASLTTAGYTFTNDTTDKSGGTQSFKGTKTAAANDFRVTNQVVPVIPGETYSIKIRVKGNVASAAGFYFRQFTSATKPASNYLDDTNYTNFNDIVANGAITSSWATYEGTYTIPGGMYWMSVNLIMFTSSTNTTMWWDDLSIGRQITASFLAAGSIAVGTAAIATGAINTAMIGLLQVDAARIANATITDAQIGSLNAGKITAGFLSAARIDANTITAAMINSNGLTIKDAAGNVILSSGTVSGSGNLCVNSDFLLSSAGIPSGWGNYNNGAISLTNTVNAGGPLSGSNYWRIHTNASTVAQLGFYFISAANSFGGFKANTTYAISFYARMSSNAGGCNFQTNWNNPPAVNYFLTNPVVTTAWQRYVAIINFVNNTIDINGYMNLTPLSVASGVDLDFACVQVEQGDAASGWSPPPVTSLNPITGANISTFIASASITDAQIGSLNANKITAGSIRGISVQGSSHVTKGTFLVGVPAANAATVNVDNTADFAASGSFIVIDTLSNTADVVAYTGKTSTSFTGCTTSGVNAIVGSHTDGATVVPLLKNISIDQRTNDLRIYGDRGDGVIDKIGSSSIQSPARRLFWFSGRKAPQYLRYRLTATMPEMSYQQATAGRGWLYTGPPRPGTGW
jgi:hypothetical protein